MHNEHLLQRWYRFKTANSHFLDMPTKLETSEVLSCVVTVENLRMFWSNLLPLSSGQRFFYFQSRTIQCINPVGIILHRHACVNLNAHIKPVVYQPHLWSNWKKSCRNGRERSSSSPASQRNVRGR